jgi:hypothetical protein
MAKCSAAHFGDQFHAWTIEPGLVIVNGLGRVPSLWNRLRHAASQVVALVMERRWFKFSFNPCRARSVSNSLFVGPKLTCSVIPSFRSFAVKFVISPIPRWSGARNRSLK